MFKPMSKPLVTLALLAAVGVGSAQAQTTTLPRDTGTTNNPAIAMETMAPSGADAGKLIGRSIKNMQNDTIGEIKSIHLDSSGKVDAVIASVGGFLGIGDREVLLAWRDLKIEGNGEAVRVNMTKDDLNAKPAYTYKDEATRGKVFSERGVWTDTHASAARAPDTRAADARPSDGRVTDARPADRAATPADRRNDMAAATSTRTTGDFNAAGQMSAEAVIGKTVRNAANETVGKISDVYLDASGAVKLVVVSVGGFLGVGSKDVGVPWADLKFGRDDNAITVQTSWTKDSLKSMPDYKDERRVPASTTRSGG